MTTAPFQQQRTASGSPALSRAASSACLQLTRVRSLCQFICWSCSRAWVWEPESAAEEELWAAVDWVLNRDSALRKAMNRGSHSSHV